MNISITEAGQAAEKKLTVRPFAMTYPQLMRQAESLDISRDDCLALKNAYDVCEHIMNGLYRAQGSPFICHLVRTASIVMAERQPMFVTIAALLHAAYTLDSFTSSRRKKANPKHRARLAAEIGTEAEALVWAYRSFPWYGKSTLEQHIRSCGHYPQEVRYLLIMRLANELEDYMDQAMAYRDQSDALWDKIECTRREKVALARAMGLAQLAAELDAVFTETLARKSAPPHACRTYGDAYELSPKRWWEMNAFERAIARWPRPIWNQIKRTLRRK